MSEVMVTEEMVEAGRQEMDALGGFVRGDSLSAAYRAMRALEPPGSSYDIRRFALQLAADVQSVDVVGEARQFEAYLLGGAPGKPELQPTMADAVKAIAILHEAALGFYKSEKIGRRSGASIGYASGQVDALSDVLAVLTGSHDGRSTDAGADNE